MPVPAVAPPSGGGGGGGGGGSAGVVLATPTLALGGLELNRVDEYGVEWVCTGLDGWEGFTANGPLDQLSGDHGAGAGEQFLTERVLTLAGQLRASDPQSRAAAVERFARYVPLNFEGTVLRVDETPAKQTEVRISGSVSVDSVDDRAIFTLGLTARDPRKYATGVFQASAVLTEFVTGLVPPLTPPLLLPEAPNGDLMSLSNDGNFPTGAQMRIFGPVARPRVTRQDTGQALWWDVTVDAGQFLDVDTRLRQAWLEGSAYRPAGFGSSWFAVPPGGCVVGFTGDPVPGVSGAGAVTVETRSAWL